VIQEEDKGGILFSATNDWVLDGPPGRVSISIDPPPDDGPFYWDDSVQNVADATEISTNAPLVSFFNADEGEYRITWEVQEPENMHCAILGFDEIYGSAGGYIFGLPASVPNTVRIYVRAGFVSAGTIVCLLDTDADADAGL
jgi:hypothetical protein